MWTSPASREAKYPFEAQSLRWPVRTDADIRYLNDPAFQGKTKNSLKIDDLDFTGYDAVFMAGGWGAAFDMGSSEVLGQKTTDAYVDGAVLGSVCHGALGLLNTKDENGALLLQGRKITGVTDKQVKELGGMDSTPQHPETELRKVGVDYQCETAVLDALADLTVVDGRIVTGQNQNAGAETAQKIMALLEQAA